MCKFEKLLLSLSPKSFLFLLFLFFDKSLSWRIKISPLSSICGFDICKIINGKIKANISRGLPLFFSGAFTSLSYWFVLQFLKNSMNVINP